MTVFFQNSAGVLRPIGDVDGSMPPESLRAAISRQIKAFCDERNYKIYYTRIWDVERDGAVMTQFDVGSHTEFFFTKPSSLYAFR